MLTKQEYRDKLNDAINYLNAATEAIGFIGDIEDEDIRKVFRRSLDAIEGAVAKVDKESEKLDKLQETEREAFEREFPGRDYDLLVSRHIDECIAAHEQEEIEYMLAVSQLR